MNNWLDYAECRGMNTDLFFANSKKQYEDIDLITVTCMRCPVKMDCLDDGVRHKDRDAFLGTTRPEEREQLISAFKQYDPRELYGEEIDLIASSIVELGFNV